MLVGVSDKCFLFFSARRRGRGSSGRQGGGGSALMKSQEGGGLPGGVGGEGAGRVSAGNLFFLFFGAEIPTKKCWFMQTRQRFQPQKIRLPHV